MKLKDIESIRAFTLVYQERNFTKAAKRMGVSKAAIAKRVSVLELDLKTRLFLRSTRRVMPTPDADSLYRNSLRVLDSVRDLETSFLNKEEMEGVIRVTCVASMATRFVSRLLMEFQAKHPKITVELVVTDSFLDLIENNIDIALRVGRLPASSLTGKKLGSNKLSVCASPDYLRKKKAPKKAAELSKHPLLFLDAHLDISFTESKTALKDLAPSRKFLSNDAPTLTKLGLEGHGILVRSRWDLAESFKKGELVEILQDDPLEDFGDVWMLASAGRLQAKRVRALFHFFEEKTKDLF